MADKIIPSVISTYREEIIYTEIQIWSRNRFHPWTGIWKTLEDKKCSCQMTEIARSLWTKYYSGQSAPKDNFGVIQKVLDKIQMQHTSPKNFFDSLTNHVSRLKRFIVEKKLFDFDTVAPPIKVRLMPEYARGFSVASAEFTPPYQKSGTTYYNIDDLIVFSWKAEGVLKEYNDYASQLLSIHEAVRVIAYRIYNNKNHPMLSVLCFRTEPW